MTQPNLHDNAALGVGINRHIPGHLWPWDRSWFKPGTPRCDLIKAGALIVAEIKRLDRAAQRKERYDG